MFKKNFMVFILIGSLLLLSSNVIAAQDNTTDTLDIEKAAIETINNSQSVKTFDEETKDANKKYNDAQAAVQSAAHAGMASVQAIIISPIEAKNTFDKFTINKGINTNSVKIGAYSKYITLLKASYAASIQSGLTNNLEKDNENAKLQLANGLITTNNARLIEINYLKSVHQLSRLQNSLESAYMAVNLAMGEDISKRYSTLIDNNTQPVANTRTLDNYIKGALLNRGEIVNAQNTLDAKKKELPYQKQDTYPEIKKTQYDMDNAQNSIDKAKITVQLEINNGYKTLGGYSKAMESQQANYDLAKANYEAAKVQYDNSMLTLNQFEEVEVTQVQAQMNLKNAQLDLWLEQTKMSYASDLGPALN